MASKMESAIKDVLSYAADDSHGYVLQGDNYSKGTDCAGLVRYYVARMEGVSPSRVPELDTWDMRSILSKRGWAVTAFSKSKLKRGDVLLRERSDGTGHAVIWLGSDRIVGAEGNWDGKSGDGSGTEVCERSYYSYGYNYILRPPAKYSSASSSGSSSGAASKGFGGTYRCTVDGLRIRKSPSTSGAVDTAACYNRGDRVVLDDWYCVGDGYVWGRYRTAASGSVRYVAVGPYTGKAEANDYLVKVSGSSSGSKTVKVGSRVRLKKQVAYDGTKLAMTGTYTVSEVKGDRVVLKSGSTVMAAVAKSNLTVV